MMLKTDIFLIDILLHYLKSSSGKLMLRITRLYGLIEEPVEAEDVKIDYPDTLELHLLGTCIGIVYG